MLTSAGFSPAFFAFGFASSSRLRGVLERDGGLPSRFESGAFFVGGMSSSRKLAEH
jgi:hypothetical protein